MPSSVINDGSLETGRAPTSSPILDGLSDPSSITAEQMQQEALVRLQNLQQQIVGGEKKDDNQLKEKHKKRKDHVFSRKEKLVNALKTLDNSDQVVIKVYDSLQDEIKANNKKSKHLEDELKSAKGEIDDLQVEFEREKITSRRYASRKCKCRCRNSCWNGSSHCCEGIATTRIWITSWRRASGTRSTPAGSYPNSSSSAPPCPRRAQSHPPPASPSQATRHLTVTMTPAKRTGSCSI